MSIDVPVVLWREEVHRARAGYFIRVHLFQTETDTVVITETSNSPDGPWAPTTCADHA